MTLPTPAPVILGICLVVAALALVWLAFAVRGRRRFMRHAMRSTGVVQSLRARSLSRDSTLYFPIVRFTTAAGTGISAESGTGRKAGVHRVGQSVRVLYDAEQPSDMRIDSFSSRWIGILLPAFVAFVALVTAGVALLALR